MAGFNIDIEGAEELIRRCQESQRTLLAGVHRETMAAGLLMQTTARGLARSKTMPGLSRSIYRNTKKFANGTEVTVEAKSPFGFIREFGAGRSGPHPFMKPALDMHVAGWESALADLLESTL